jgi:hypothetical protein
MDDAGAMRRVERIGDLDRRLQRPVERQRAALEGRRQRLAFEELHDEIGDAVVASDVVQRADVRMTETGDRPRLALEALRQVGVGGEVRRQNLEGDDAAESCIGGTVDFAHPAGTDRGQDFVRSKPASDGQRVVRHAALENSVVDGSPDENFSCLNGPTIGGLAPAWRRSNSFQRSPRWPRSSYTTPMAGPHALETCA